MREINIHHIESIIDGDSVWVWLDMGLSIFVRKEIRLFGIDTPEKSTEAGKKVKQFLINWFETNKDNIRLMIDDTPEKFGRILGEFSANEQSLNHYLLEQKIAKPFSGHEKRSWTQEELDLVCLWFKEK